MQACAGVPGHELPQFGGWMGESGADLGARPRSRARIAAAGSTAAGGSAGARLSLSWRRWQSPGPRWLTCGGGRRAHARRQLTWARLGRRAGDGGRVPRADRAPEDDTGDDAVLQAHQEISAPPAGEEAAQGREAADELRSAHAKRHMRPRRPPYAGQTGKLARVDQCFQRNGTRTLASTSFCAFGPRGPTIGATAGTQPPPSARRNPESPAVAGARGPVDHMPAGAWGAWGKARGSRGPWGAAHGEGGAAGAGGCGGVGTGGTAHTAGTGGEVWPLVDEPASATSAGRGWGAGWVPTSTASADPRLGETRASASAGAPVLAAPASAGRG